MSKTKGNVVDPLEAIDESGADALRFALVHGAAPGNDQRFSAEKLANARNFTNKLWNAARWLLGARPDSIPPHAARIAPDPARLGPVERWLMSRVATTIAEVDRALGEYSFADVTRLLYDATWNDYCDWAIELAKVRLGDASLSAEDREATWWTMVAALDTYLRLLHPIIPFVTEAIWAELPKGADDPELLIVARWPEPGEIDPEAEAPIAAAIELVRAVRNARSEARVEPATWLPVHVAVGDDLAPAWDAVAPAVERLARARPLVRVASAGDLAPARVPGALAAIAGATEAVVQPAAADDAGAERERARLERELAEAEGLLDSARARLANPSFVERAPAPVVDGARAREAELADLVARLRERLAG